MEDKINHLASSEKSSKKRVLFVVTQSEMGGAQRFLCTLIPRLDKDKYEIAVAAGPQDRVKDQELRIKEKTRNYPLLEILEKENIKTHKLKRLKREINPWKDLLAAFELKKLIRSWQPDILFLNSSKAGFLGSFVSRFLIPDSKFLILYRIGGWTFNDPWPRWKKTLWIILEKISAKWKDFIILNNRHDFDQAIKLKIKPRRSLELVYNGIDLKKLELLEPDRARLEILKKISSQGGNVFQAKYVIGTAANFYKTKGLEYLIEAAVNLPEELSVISVIIGEGKERKYLENLIEKNGLRSKVFLAGAMDNASQYLKAFDVFVLPSVKEGFPWTLLEAMAAKIPIVATSVGAIPEVIEQGKNGFVVAPKNPKAIAESITAILSNDKLRQELGIQAHQTVLFKFGLDKMVNQIEELL